MGWGRGGTAGQIARAWRRTAGMGSAKAVLGVGAGRRRTASRARATTASQSPASGSAACGYRPHATGRSRSCAVRRPARCEGTGTARRKGRGGGRGSAGRRGWGWASPAPIRPAYRRRSSRGRGRPTSGWRVGGAGRGGGRSNRGVSVPYLGDSGEETGVTPGERDGVAPRFGSAVGFRIAPIDGMGAGKAIRPTAATHDGQVGPVGRVRWGRGGRWPAIHRPGSASSGR